MDTLHADTVRTYNPEFFRSLKAEIKGLSPDAQKESFYERLDGITSTIFGYLQHDLKVSVEFPKKETRYDLEAALQLLASNQDISLSAHLCAFSIVKLRKLYNLLEKGAQPVSKEVQSIPEIQSIKDISSPIDAASTPYWEVSTAINYLKHEEESRKCRYTLSDTDNLLLVEIIIQLSKGNIVQQPHGEGREQLVETPTQEHPVSDLKETPKNNDQAALQQFRDLKEAYDQMQEHEKSIKFYFDSNMALMKEILEKETELGTLYAEIKNKNLALSTGSAAGNVVQWGSGIAGVAKLLGLAFIPGSVPVVMLGSVALMGVGHAFGKAATELESKGEVRKDFACGIQPLSPQNISFESLKLKEVEGIALLYRNNDISKFLVLEKLRTSMKFSYKYLETMKLYNTQFNTSRTDLKSYCEKIKTEAEEKGFLSTCKNTMSALKESTINSYGTLCDLGTKIKGMALPSAQESPKEDPTEEDSKK